MAGVDGDLIGWVPIPPQVDCRMPFLSIASESACLTRGSSQGGLPVLTVR